METQFKVRGITTDGGVFHDERAFKTEAEAIAHARTFIGGGFDRLEVWEMDGATRLRAVPVFP